MNQDGAQDAAKFELRGRPGLEIRSFYINFGIIFDAFWLISCISKNFEKLYVFKGFLKVWRSSMAQKSKKNRLRLSCWLQDGLSWAIWG